MEGEDHYRALERMYGAAPINGIFQPRLTVTDGAAVVEMELTRDLHHAAGAAHGAVYFKMLDDAAFFAANSLETEVFVPTASFTTYLTHPVVSGTLRSTGKVVSRTRSQFIAEAVISDRDGKEVGRGNGIFVRGKLRLETALGYKM